MVPHGDPGRTSAADRGRRADGVTVLIPYMQQEGAAVVAGKTYLPPKCWRQADQPEAYITFDTGEQFGFFLVGTWEGQEPVCDQDWPEVMYASGWSACRSRRR